MDVTPALWRAGPCVEGVPGLEVRLVTRIERDAPFPRLSTMFLSIDLCHHPLVFQPQ